jgi:hypothetical protein
MAKIWRPEQGVVSIKLGFRMCSISSGPGNVPGYQEIINDNCHRVRQGRINQWNVERNVNVFMY